jgi:hypothetical protein
MPGFETKRSRGRYVGEEGAAEVVPALMIRGAVWIYDWSAHDLEFERENSGALIRGGGRGQLIAFWICFDPCS